MGTSILVFLLLKKSEEYKCLSVGVNAPATLPNINSAQNACRLLYRGSELRAILSY